MAAGAAMAMTMTTTANFSMICIAAHSFTIAAAAPLPSCSSLLSHTSSTHRRLRYAKQPHLPIRRFCSISATKEPNPNHIAVTTPFHLAIPVHDIHAAREFFGGVLGCPEGRSAKTWVDFNLFGHQVVCHEVRNYNASSTANAVDGDPVPVPHFGLAMSVTEFHALAERVKAAGVKFIIEPHIRFVGQPGEQWTMFFKDSSGNALEFKAMTTPSNLFAKYVVE